VSPEYEKYLNWLKSLKEGELRAFSEQVFKDLEKASLEQNNSEWHESCFAALCVVAQVAIERKIILRS